jgi:hypothetical protein
VCHQGRRLGLEREVAEHGGRAVTEEDHRVGAGDRVGRVVARRDGQRAGAEDPLAWDPQRLAACREQAQLRAGAQEVLGKPGTGVDEVFAIVEHEQQLRLSQALQDVPEQAAVRPLAHTENTGNRLQDQLRIEHRRQIDHPGAIPDLLGHSCGDLDRQPGLSGPAGPRQGDETGAAEQRREFLELPLASNKAGELGQQIVAAGRRGAKQREIVR